MRALDIHRAAAVRRGVSDRLSFENDALQNEGTEVSCVLLTLWIYVCQHDIHCPQRQLQTL